MPEHSNIQIAGGDTAQPLAMARRLKVVARYLREPGKRFLDCGCGSGSYVLALRERYGVDACGLEYSKEKVSEAALNPALQQHVSWGDLHSINSASNVWDYAMLNEVLEHVPDDRKALSEVYRVLKPEGLLFVFSPNRLFPIETHGVELKKSRRAVRWPFIPYLPVRFGSLFFDYWARNYWPAELRAMVQDAGFRVIERTTIWLTFENISRSQSSFLDAWRPFLRFISNGLERTPLLSRFGPSQVLVCRK